MPHAIERASSGRSKCRGCGEKIVGGDLRLGERLPNPFDDTGGEMTHWFHVACAAYRRPEVFREAAAGTAEAIPDREVLDRQAELGVAHRRLPRLSAAERASSGRAACRSCKEPIQKDAWRIGLLYYEDGRFTPSGFIHTRGASSYFETMDVMTRVKHFSTALSSSDLAEIQGEIEAGKSQGLS